jgi:hypothetical protein
MPVLLPIDHVGGFRELTVISFRAHRKAGVLEENFERIFADFRGEIVDGRTGHE